MSQLKKTALLLADLLTLYLALVLTVLLRYGNEEFGGRFKAHFLPFSVIFFLWALVFYLADLYRQSTLRNRGIFFTRLAQTMFAAVIVSIVLFYLFGAFFELTPKTNLFILSAVFFFLEYLWRSAMFKVLRAGNAGVIIVGDSPLVAETARFINENPDAGYRIVLWEKNGGAVANGKLKEAVKNSGASLIVIQPKTEGAQAAVSAAYRAMSLGVNIMGFPDFYELIFEKVPLSEVDEEWFVENIKTRRPIYETAKELTDVVFSFVLLLVLLPISAIVGAMVALTSRGPIIHKQKRVGRNGHVFVLYKFRSMYNNHNGPAWTEKNDERITPVGRVIRFTHLDEIPQLVNIIRGDIAFVGPRPENTELREKYKNLPYYEIREIVRPGLSGWAQLNYRPSASVEEAYKKLLYDIYYVKNRSFVLDVLIVLRTTKHFFLSHE